MSFLAALGLLCLAVAVLLVLVLILRVHGFLALLAVSLLVALVGGIPVHEIAGEMQKAMGSTLGYIAIVIALGAIFGEMLQRSGGAGVIAHRLLSGLGERRAPLALGLTGLVVAIPVFFDVAFILFVPLLKTLHRRTGKPLIGFAIPLLAGLAVAHAFIPPTPGPVAVAGLLGADLGWVIFFGLIAGIPALWIGGLLFGAWLARAGLGELDTDTDAEAEPVLADTAPSFAGALGLVALPLVLILTATASKVWLDDGTARMVLQLVGHPFVALLLTVAMAWIWLGKRCAWSREQLEAMASSALQPVGAILLLTGAGGVLGKMLLATGAGGVLAEGLSASGLPVLALGFVTALALRVAQGSATVSMVTAAGLITPILEAGPVGARTTAALVVAIAAGATAISHVNDSGFWLVSRYLGLTEKQTLRSWTLMTLLVGLVGFLAVSGASLVLAESPTVAAEMKADAPSRDSLGRLEASHPSFHELIPKGAELEILADGFEWAEGPVWVPDQRFVLFSDVPKNRIYRWREGQGLDVWMEPSGYTGTVPRGGEPGSNGLFLDAQGRLILTQHGDRRIARLLSPWERGPFVSEPAIFETLADTYGGKRFNSPNDLVLHSNGQILFTDPPYGLEGGPDGPGRELDIHGVYRVTPSGVELLSDELSRPNGIALSPDERTVYVANSDPERALWMAFDLTDQGPLSGRVFFDATDQVGDERPGLPDGLAVDTKGNLFATGPGGVWVFAPSGEPLGTVRLPLPAANCTFGGENGNDLFITADRYLLRLRTQAVGVGFAGL